MELSHILVPLDESALSRLSLEPAYLLARKFDAAVRLLIVVDQGAASVLQAIADSEGIPIQRAAEAMLEQAAAEYPDVNTATTVIIDDDPAHAIVSFAGKHPIDLIVMATHGRSGVGRWLLGSVTSKVLRSSPAPIYVLPAPSRREIAH